MPIDQHIQAGEERKAALPSRLEGGAALMLSEKRRMAATNRERKTRRPRTIIYAHRGASAYCPENTMSAFYLAVQLGADGIETDVQLTKDGKLVLIHDDSVVRTAGGQGRVRDLTLEELRRLDAGGWFHPAYAGERIPLLEELLQLAKSSGIFLNLELKGDPSGPAELEKKTIRLIQSCRMQGRVILSSFNAASLAACKRIDPSVRTGFLYSYSLEKPWTFLHKIRADALHPASSLVTKKMVDAARRRGIEVNSWTANQAAEIRRMLECGVDGIISDVPDRAAAVRHMWENGNAVW